MAVSDYPDHTLASKLPDPDAGDHHRHRAVANLAAAVKQRAYRFDGLGNYFIKDWDLTGGASGEFHWYHVELPKGNHHLAQSAQHLIEALCPPFRLHDILTLISNGPFVGHVDGALVFRVNSPGPAASDFTLRLAARVTENSVITVSLGRVPRLGFSPAGRSLLSEVPSLEAEKAGAGAVVIPEHVLEFLMTMNHSEEGDNPVPRTVSNLLVHIIDTHVDHIQDIVTKLEMELDSVELDLDKGGSTFKKKMLDDRRFQKMHLNLQRLLQVVSHCEQIFPRVKEKCAVKSWFAIEDIVALEELVGRIRRIKENLGFLVNRVMAVQAGLNSWQSEQINKKLYYLSFLSMIFLPLSVVTGLFGMNVGGVPWTGQGGLGINDGFLNVLMICAVLLLILLLLFMFPSIFYRFTTWRGKLLNKTRSFGRRSSYRRSGCRRGSCWLRRRRVWNGKGWQEWSSSKRWKRKSWEQWKRKFWQWWKWEFRQWRKWESRRSCISRKRWQKLLPSTLAAAATIQCILIQQPSLSCDQHQTARNCHQHKDGSEERENHCIRHH